MTDVMHSAGIRNIILHGALLLSICAVWSVSHLAEGGMNEAFVFHMIDRENNREIIFLEIIDASSFINLMLSHLGTPFLFLPPLRSLSYSFNEISSYHKPYIICFAGIAKHSAKAEITGKHFLLTASLLSCSFYTSIPLLMHLFVCFPLPHSLHTLSSIPPRWGHKYKNVTFTAHKSNHIQLEILLNDLYLSEQYETDWASQKQNIERLRKILCCTDHSQGSIVPHADHIAVGVVFRYSIHRSFSTHSNKIKKIKFFSKTFIWSLKLFGRI